MKTSLRCAVSLVLLYIIMQSFVHASACVQYKKHVNDYYSSIRLHTYLPQGQVGDIERAYIIQKCIVDSASSKIIGYKAGLMNKSLQQRFNAQSPVMGVLLQKHINQPLMIKVENDFLFEVELAFKLDRTLSGLNDIDQPLESIIGSVAIALEVANINFKFANKLNVYDVVAANVGAAYIYLGEFVDFKKADLSGVKVAIKHNSNDELSGRPIPNDYITQLKWLLRKVYLEGYQLEEGMILMAGSISQPSKLKPGNYHVDAGALGKKTLLVH